jgi:hypothetical protein
MVALLKPSSNLFQYICTIQSIGVVVHGWAQTDGELWSQMFDKNLGGRHLQNGRNKLFLIRLLSDLLDRAKRGNRFL